MAFEIYYTYGSLTRMYTVECVWEKKVEWLTKLGEKVWLMQVIVCGENSNEYTCSMQGR